MGSVLMELNVSGATGFYDLTFSLIGVVTTYAESTPFYTTD